MALRQTKNIGVSLLVVGVAAIVFAVLTGLITETGAVDWISMVTAVAGTVVGGEGLYVIFHKRGQAV
jgi:hypothetical protein